MNNSKMIIQALLCFVLILGMIIPTPLVGASSVDMLATDDRPAKHSIIDGPSDAMALTLSGLQEGVKPMVAAGGGHTVGLKSDGTVVAAGYDLYGQCNVGDWTGIVQVAAGLGHTVGLKSDGSVVAVGFNYFGQCEVGDWTDIVQVSACRGHTVGLKPDGSVVAVGWNYHGQCNVGDWMGIVQVAAGNYHTVGLKSDGTVVAVGWNDDGQCNVEDWTGIVQVAAGQAHTVGLKSDGTVVAVGYNDYEQCDVAGWTDIVQVAAGVWHTVGLKSDSTVVAVGSNSSGQCAVGAWTDIVQVAAGSGHTVGLKSDGTVVAVGYGFYGQCNVGQWTGIVEIAAGPRYTLGLKSDGSVVAVGLDYYGECSLGDWMDIVQVAAGCCMHTVGARSDGTVVAVGHNTYRQCNVGDWTGIVQVAPGCYHTVGVKSDRTVMAVGHNTYRQCNVGDWTGIVQVAAGNYHTVGVKSDGSAVAVGDTRYGMCNLGDWTDIVQVAAGREHTVGVKSDGTVVAVGQNHYGQCNVGDWTGIVQVAASWEHTVGVKSDGTVVAVGDNTYRQCNLGDWTGIVQVAAGREHTVGLKSDGTVVAAGLEVELAKWNLGATTPKSGLADSAWPKFRHNAQNTGRSPYTGPQTPELKWTFITDGSVASSPAIGADGTIYVGSNDNNLYAINPDGSKKWSFPTKGAVRSSPAIGADGTIYLGAFDASLHHDGRYYAVNPDGSEKWAFEIGERVYSSPSIGVDGTIYVGMGGHGCDVYALNADGSEKWRFATNGGTDGSPAIGTDGTIYVTTGGIYGRTYAINPDGTQKWSSGAAGRGYNTPAVGMDGTVYAVLHQYGLVALDPDGNKQWGPVADIYCAWASPSIGADGTIYVGSLYASRLYAIDPDGNIKWSFVAGSWVQSSPAIGADGTIYVGSHDGKLYAVNPNGTEKWSFATGGQVFSSPAIGADGTIYVGSHDGKLYAIGEAAAPSDAPIARASDISGQPKIMYRDNPYTVTAKYFDPDGREDLKYCYLRLTHPSKNLTMMWDQATDDFWRWAGEEGENYLTAVSGNATPITEGGLQGYKIAWTFNISEQWPEVEDAIDFGVLAWDDSDLKSGWDYDDTKASFRLSIPGLTVISIEPIQVVADAEALIMNKPTVIRATVESTFETRTWTEMSVTYDFGTKTYLETGPAGEGVPIDPGLNTIYIPGGPASSQTATQVPWADFCGGFCWTNAGVDTDIIVELHLPNENAEAGGPTYQGITEMEVVETALLRVLVVPVYFPLKVFPQFPYSPSRDHLDDQFGFLHMTYPLALGGIEVTYADTRAIWSTWPAWGEDNWLYRKVAVPISNEAETLGYDRVVIIIKHEPKWAGTAIGMSTQQPENRTPVIISNVALGKQEYLHLIAHEIGHTYYLWHPHRIGPRIHFAERYMLFGREYGDTARNLMAYGKSEYAPNGYDPNEWVKLPSWIDKGRFDTDIRTWIDPKGDPEDYGIHPDDWSQLLKDGFKGTWRWNLLDQFRLHSGPEVVSLSGAFYEDKSLTSGGSEIILLGGELYDDGTVTVGPWHRLSEGNPDRFLDAPGSHSVVLLDDHDRILEQLHFNVYLSYLMDIDGVLTPMETDVMPFLFSIPYIDGTSVIQIRDASGNVLVSRRISPNAPTVNVTYPNGGEVLPGLATHTLSWEAHDLDGDALTYMLAYSSNGGKTWIPIASELTETSYAWDTSLLAGGTDYLVKVIASDGVNTGYGISDDTFTILDGWTQATVGFDPNTLNLRARSGLVTVFIELPAGFDVHDVDISAIRLNGTVPPLSWPTSIGDYNDNGVPDLMVKFDRRAVHEVVEVGESVEITITGEVDGTPFLGVDTIKVIG